MQHALVALQHKEASSYSIIISKFHSFDARGCRPVLTPLCTPCFE